MHIFSSCCSRDSRRATHARIASCHALCTFHCILFSWSRAHLLRVAKLAPFPSSQLLPPGQRLCLRRPALELILFTECCRISRARHLTHMHRPRRHCECVSLARFPASAAFLPGLTMCVCVCVCKSSSVCHAQCHCQHLVAIGST